MSVPNDLQKNFSEVVSALKPKEAIDEANRCLYCYDAPCIKACPTSIDIPSFIRKIATGNLLGSARTIMESNPVGASCARVCPTEELCEGACVLNHASKPIMIGLLQRHATDWAIRNNAALFQKGDPNGKRVAIIGAGPAGLSAARELARLGYEVTIYEAKERAGGLNTYGIVSFRLPQEISLWEVEQVEALGVTIKTNTRIGVDIMPDELVANYDSVLLAVGMSSVPSLHIPGEELEGVLDAIALVEDTKTKPLTTDMVGKKVVVIGAGNTAIDAATCSKRLGADNVQILYRRTVQEMSCYQFEYEFAKQDGVEFRWLVAPTRVLGNKGRVTGLELIRMELGEPDAKGRKRPVPIPGSEFFIEVDFVVKAIGQNRHLSLIDQLGLQHQNGIVTVEDGTYRTSHPKVFAAGDVIFGGGKTDAMVVDAANHGKRAAYAIDKAIRDQKQLV
ncbi:MULTISPECIES: NAD(P)-dependent oxidoreductase [Brevibacillus]|uniref:Glutamate synthase small subunit protein n=1 Tax=Brevibacillus agri TaxID=51101 RepID=Q846U7_9BACL|nr:MULTISPECIES: NAD(P)-dependent oxidoreductase [Brevibacillus]AAO66290.1 glutamate synthase small subunit protein [Brevibacillus agri]EJL45467.1 NADPH-dependent glutamate synthase beta chain-like oxidoreductase [Brevibacillus sp. CF112]MDN4092244.1 NAD(P)-dependent oxidoreductase [Brevibacillus agri]MED1823168.1 NAD(P)-dependent oxidoreductase [Brevibacillus agri]MED3497266.1 NAD(P)-dependent oxidoreductase [Brevibacillus agri]